MTRPSLYASILICASALCYGLVITEHITSAVSAGLLGLAWIFSHLRGMKRVNTYIFALFIFITIVALWAELLPWLAFTCVIFALFAWDLSVFDQRLQFANSTDRRAMERAHLGRLAMVAGLAVVGFIEIANLRVDLTFGAAALLALLCIWGISALVYRLRSYE